MDPTAPVEYEEHWSPLRLGLGLIALCLIFLTIYSLFNIGLISFDQSEIRDSCLLSAQQYSTTLRALKSKDASLCQYAHNPVFCTAELLKSTEPCESLLSKEQSIACIFLATKDPDYCHKPKAWCDMMISLSPESCTLLAPYQQQECIDTARRDYQGYVAHQDPVCRDLGWTTAIKKRLGVLSSPVLWVYDTFLSYL